MWPVLFHLGTAPVRTYGVLVTLGYLAGAVWLMRQLKYLQKTEAEFWGTEAELWSLIAAIMVGAILGAKLGFYVFEWRQFHAYAGWYLRHWRQGWVFWSGLLGTMAAGWIFQQVYNRLYRPRRYLPVADYFLTSLPIGHAIGRLGCFAQGCCYGLPTQLPWGVRFADRASSVAPSLLGVPLHPVQLYEAAGEAAIAALLVFYVLPAIRARRLAYGVAFYGYIVLYSALRFLLEFLRGDERGAFLWPILSPSQWVSLGSFLIGAFLLHKQGIYERDPKGRSIYV